MSQVAEIVVAGFTIRYGSGAHMSNIRLGAFSKLLYVCHLNQNRNIDKQSDEVFSG